MYVNSTEMAVGFLAGGLMAFLVREGRDVALAIAVAALAVLVVGALESPVPFATWRRSIFAHVEQHEAFFRGAALAAALYATFALGRNSGK